MSDPTRLEAASYRAAAPGTLRALHGAVVARMGEIVAPLWSLSTKSGGERAPLVIHGFVPPKTPAGEQFPFVIVRPREGDDSQQGAAQDAVATVELVIGVYRDTDDGWLDAIDVVDAIRLDLGAAPVLAGTAFEHTGPLRWNLLDTDPPPRPQWLVLVKTIWTLPRPRRIEARNPTED